MAKEIEESPWDQSHQPLRSPVLRCFAAFAGPNSSTSSARGEVGGEGPPDLGFSQQWGSVRQIGGLAMQWGSVHRIFSYRTRGAQCRRLS